MLPLHSSLAITLCLGQTSELASLHLHSPHLLPPPPIVYIERVDLPLPPRYTASPYPPAPAALMAYRDFPFFRLSSRRSLEDLLRAVVLLHPLTFRRS
ncbi:hypothetical protein NUW54_g14092 [Trametes sanguinea]|uniref:Uncharacterized protein n=1 Tax=Trametes sanguinea TaxID=158606 RepID=A0ACC1MFR2_9APHY|nr:hypothetical protein NUW54_g14092 [Trametes sanguinea]